jgi:hypothetical protein
MTAARGNKRSSAAARVWGRSWLSLSGARAPDTTSTSGRLQPAHGGTVVRCRARSHWPLEKDRVSVQMQLLSIDSVSTKLQLLEVELYLRVVWHDWRLRFNTTTTGGSLTCTS